MCALSQEEAMAPAGGCQVLAHCCAEPHRLQRSATLGDLVRAAFGDVVPELRHAGREAPAGISDPPPGAGYPVPGVARLLRCTRCDRRGDGLSLIPMTLKAAVVLLSLLALSNCAAAPSTPDELREYYRVSQQKFG